MQALPPLRRCVKRFRAFRAAAHGVAAVEFALILPLMLLLYFGSVQVTQGIRASRKVDLVASALANLTSQQLTCSTTPGSTTPCLTDTDMTTGANAIFSAAAAIMSPYTTTNLAMTVSQVTVQTYNGALIAKVNWTVTNNGGTARLCNAGGPNSSLLSGNVSPGSANFQKYMPTSYTATGAPTGSMIVADVVYTYRPGFGFDVFKSNGSATAIPMAAVGYYRNRNSSGGAAGKITASMTSGLTTCP